METELENWRTHGDKCKCCVTGRSVLFDEDIKSKLKVIEYGTFSDVILNYVKENVSTSF